MIKIDLEQELSNILTEEIARELILQKAAKIDEDVFNTAVKTIRETPGLSGMQCADICVQYHIMLAAREINLNKESPTPQNGV